MSVIRQRKHNAILMKCKGNNREMSLIELADYAGLDVAAVVKEEKEN